jgi:trimeric autotransporter adhesin
LLTAIEPGSTQVTASFQGVSSPAAITVTVITAAPIISGYLGTPNNTNTLAPCGTVQFTAYATYADGTTATVTPLSWSTSNSVIGTISSTGLFTANVPGMVSVYAQLSSTVAASRWDMTIAAAPAVTVPLAPGTYTIVVPACGTASISGTGVSVSQ